ncbi:MAG: S8 family peptidase [Desulfurellaceae bacterium]|nr:S8 family peptidase [Desulfurellaceae bacterium]
MAEGTDGRHPHFVLEGITETEGYRSPQSGGKRSHIPERNRAQHGGALQQQINEIRTGAGAAREAQRAAGIEEKGLGLQVEFESFPDIELAFESLAREHWGIELLNVRHEDKRILATVFVPDGKLDHFENLIRAYLEERRDRNGRARDHRKLIDAIQRIRAASLRALWTDSEEAFPTENGERFWWEVWLPVRGNSDATAANVQETTTSFQERAEAQDIRIAPGKLVFPERTVLLAFASVDQMQHSMVTLNTIAELRRAKETADFFDSQSPDEQREWLEDLLARTEYTSNSEGVPYICLLDTGVNRGHQLLAPALAANDLHTVEPGWGTDDADGHGTQMAGLSLAGDLTPLLAGNNPVEINHRLESVKLLPQEGATGTDPRHHGYLTAEAVARPEIAAPSRARVFGMAVTTRDNRHQGRPSAWSATLDALAVDADGYGANPRLLIVSAGNINDNTAWSNYPDSNDTDGVHDPAQAWNVLTAGAYTDLVRITETDANGYTPIASRGGLSPFSTTSLTWQPSWPLKPDIVLEGGNAAKDSLGAVWMPSLSLLTTHHQPANQFFTTANATSAATALASRLAAQVMAVYPDLWPETVRALLVHSAEWTDTMKQSFLPNSPSKNDYQRLLRRCGFGVPDINRALWSVSNSLTMVVQESLHPFQRETGTQPTLRDMHLHSLPWPRDVLESLGETEVEMRVTLSYFIEPNPSQRGRSRYRYESHGLRFDVKRPLESTEDFRSRVNAAARDEEERTRRGDDDPRWLIGKQTRHNCTGTFGEAMQRNSQAEGVSQSILRWAGGRRVLCLSGTIKPHGMP